MADENKELKETAESGEKSDSREEVKNTHNPYTPLASMLVRSYSAMLQMRDNLRDFLENGCTYTEDDAIAELTNVSVHWNFDRVQGSHIPNQPAEITAKLLDGYVDKRRKQIKREMGNAQYALDYLNWKIDVVDTAVTERLTKFEKSIFLRLFIRHWTFREIRQAYRKKLYNWQITAAENQIIAAVAAELQTRSCVRDEAEWTAALQREFDKETQRVEASSLQKQKKRSASENVKPKKVRIAGGKELYVFK